MTFKWYVYYLLVMLMTTVTANSQVVIQYPQRAQDLTVALDSTDLNISIGINDLSNNGIITVKFPQGVKYVPGSLSSKFGNLTVTELNITNLSKPQFKLGTDSLRIGDNVDFTIKRWANCDARLFDINNGDFKDSVSVQTSIGTVNDYNVNINSYNLFYPSISLTPIAAINNTVLNATHSRTITITNGGNGCANAIYFYVVYPSASFQLVNLQTPSGILSPTHTNGDTTFFKISGNHLPDNGTPNLLCNGEQLTLEENIRIIKCTPLTTKYFIAWGTSFNNYCQSLTFSPVVNLTNGVPQLSTALNNIQEVSQCRKGIKEITYTNTATGNNASAMFNVVANIGYTIWNNIPVIKDYKINNTNFSINGLPVTVTQTSTNPYVISTSQFTTDPDGVGVGLDDLDGDGEYDDLAPGKTLKIYFEEEWVCNNNCTILGYAFNIASKFNYNQMCGAQINSSTITFSNSKYIYLLPTSNTITAPNEVEGGQVFQFKICSNSLYSSIPYKPTDSSYLVLTLPAGVSYAGNSMFNGMPSNSVTQVGNQLIIRNKGLFETECISVDLAYTCGINTTIPITYELYYIADNSCACNERLACGVKNITTICPPNCTDGVRNYRPTAARTTLGYTDRTMTVKVNPAVIPPLALKTVLPKDSIQIVHNGIQLGSYNNLYYQYQIQKTNTNEALLAYASGTLFVYKAATGLSYTCNIPVPANLSTATLSIWIWDLTPLLGTSLPFTSIEPNDSLSIKVNYAVTTAKNNLLLGAFHEQPTNTESYFYNLSGAATKMYCTKWQSEFYFVGFEKDITLDGILLNSCNTGYQGSNARSYHRENNDIFPNEFRSMYYIDSVVVILPTGINYGPYSSTYYHSSWVNEFTQNTSIVTIPVPIILGNRHTYINTGHLPLSDFMPGNNYSQNTITMPIKATCGSNGVNDITYTYYVKDYFYAGPAAYEPKVTSKTANNLRYDLTKKPSLAINNNTGDVLVVNSQHYWDVAINNNSISTTPYLWMALEEQPGKLRIDSVVLKPSNVKLTPQSYDITKKWYQISATGLNAGTIQNARVYFTSLTCTTDSIKMLANWNCSSYPVNPNLGNCIDNQIWLRAFVQPSEVQLTFETEPASPTALCNLHNYIINVNSAQAAYVNDPLVAVTLPAGNLLSSSFELEYPAYSGSWQTINPVSVVGSSYTFDLESDARIGALGLKGVLTAMNNNERQTRLRFNTTTDCNFISGSQVQARVFGKTPCGTVAVGNGVTRRSNPLVINGADNSGGNISNSITFAQTVLNCTNETVATIRNIPVLADTKLGDTSIVTLPSGVEYVAGSFTPEMNCVGCSMTTVSIPGSTILKVALPIGISSGNTIAYSVRVRATATSSCDNYELETSTVRTNTGLSCATLSGGYCSYSQVLLDNKTATFSIQKPDLQITGFEFGAPSGFGIKTAILLNISNTGQQNAPAGYVVEFTCGGSSTPFQTQLLPAIAAGQSIIYADSITVSDPACLAGTAILATIRRNPYAAPSQCLCTETRSLYSRSLLPVVIKQFGLQKNGNTTQITWEVEQLEKVKSFEIQKSSNTIFTTLFEELNVLNKNYNDHSVTVAKVFYRLKINLKDGGVLYSGIISNEDNSRSGEIQIKPNPAHTSTQISVTAIATSVALIKLVSAEGRVVLVKNVSLQKGSNIITLNDLSNLANGMYQLSIYNQTTQKTYPIQKIMISH